MDWTKLLNSVGSAGTALSPWLSLGSSLFGGLLNSSSANAANQANLQMNRETNQANLLMNQRSLDAQRSNMVYQANVNRDMQQAAFANNLLMQANANDFTRRQAQIAMDYNSAPNQVRQALAAGLNPAGVNGYAASAQSGIGGSSSPSSVGLSSVPAMNPMQSGHIESVRTGDALIGVSQALSNIKSLSQVDRSLSIAAAKNDIEEDLGNRKIDVDKEIRQEANKINDRLADSQVEYQQNLIELGNAQATRLEKQTEIEMEQLRQRDEEITIQRFVAAYGNVASAAQARLAGMQAASIKWDIDNLKPKDKELVEENIKHVSEQISEIRERVNDSKARRYKIKEVIDQNLRNMRTSNAYNNIQRMLLQRTYNTILRWDEMSGLERFFAGSEFEIHTPYFTHKHQYGPVVPNY